jgi:hypothetical protein
MQRARAYLSDGVRDVAARPPPAGDEVREAMQNALAFD